MIIKPRPVITRMLNPQNDDARGIILADCADINNLYILQSGLHELNNIRKQLPEWGLPELLTPSFEKVMEKSTKSFEKMMPELFKEFSEREECGILLCKGNLTIFYGFYREKLFIWNFTDKDLLKRKSDEHARSESYCHGLKVVPRDNQQQRHPDAGFLQNAAL